MTIRAASVCLACTGALALSACKTPAGAGLRDAGDVADGMDTHADDTAKRQKWSVRMGLALGDAAGGAVVEAVEPAQFGSVVGFAKGDVIEAVNGQAVIGAEGFEAAAKAFAGPGPAAAKWDGTWIFKVKRGDRALTLKPVQGHDCDPYLLVGCGPLFGPGD